MIKNLRATIRRIPVFFSKRTNCFIALAAVTVILFGCAWLSVNTVSIKTNKGSTYQLKTMLSDPERILSALNVSYGNEDKVEVEKPSHNKLDIAVKYAFPVYITLGDTTTTVSTTGATVGELLEQAKIIVSETDIINYDLDAVINETAYIDVIDIDYVTETYTKRIYFKERTTYSSAYPKGTKIVKGGSEGVKQITCKKTIVNGVVTEETILNETVLTEAVDREIIIGTKKTQTVVQTPQESKPVSNPSSAVTTSANVSCWSTLKPSSPIALDKNGNPVEYTKHLTVQATAYLASGTCATGVRCVPGRVAVNPNYIPYGTKMYIKSSDGKYIYGYAIASDTGGFVRTKPTNVDLAFPTNADCKKFGRRNVEIYILG